MEGICLIESLIEEGELGDEDGMIRSRDVAV